MRKHHNRLYYGKYRYKTVFKFPGSLLFYPTTNEHLLHLKRIHQKAPSITFLADFILNNRNKFKFRFQDRRCMFYSDQIIAKQLIDKFWDYWISSESVDPKFINLGSNMVGCTRLPHGKFQYQVFLKKGSQYILSESQKCALWDYFERNKEFCKVTSRDVIGFLKSKWQYCTGGYFYVSEEKYLTPIYMIAQKAIDKVIKFRKVTNGSYKKTQG